MKKYEKRLNVINRRITELSCKREALIQELRKACKHLRLIELDTHPPKRICVDCGAEEEGWHCGYHVLVMNGDTWDAPHKKERVLVERTSTPSKFYCYRKGYSLYLVGQNHPNFSGGGLKTYEQLTEV